MYKDKDKQREANRKAQARFKAKGITEGITNPGITDTKRVIPNHSYIGAVPGLTTVAKPERTAQGNEDRYDRPKRLCKYCGKILEHSILTCCYECAIRNHNTGLSRTSSTKGASL